MTESLTHQNSPNSVCSSSSPEDIIIPVPKSQISPKRSLFSQNVDR
jgi:hypothetical protein